MPAKREKQIAGSKSDQEDWSPMRGTVTAAIPRMGLAQSAQVASSGFDAPTATIPSHSPIHRTMVKVVSDRV